MNRRTAAPAAWALSAVLALTGCASGGQESSSPDGRHHGSSQRAAGVNDADVMFAAMMIPHHEQAIQMSDMILSKEDIDPRVVALAKEIKAAQSPEIERMEQWLRDWDAEDRGTDASGHDGMMSHDEMTQLEEAQGLAASRFFLEQMVVHHEGAVDMAQTEIDDGSDPAAIELARTIVRAQVAEIAQMTTLEAAL